jgi:hypothetical protein
MVGSGVVEVDGFFDEPLAENFVVEVYVGLGVSGDGRYMV